MSEGGTTLYIDMAEIEGAAKLMPLVFQAIELPFFSEMDTKLDEWSVSGLMKFAAFNEVKGISDYASLVMNTEQATEYYSMDYQSSHWKLIDTSNYNLHIFTKDGSYPDNPLVMNLGYSSSYAISAKSPSPETVTGFLEWIYSSMDNYMLFMCGKEGVDYTIKDDKLSFLVNNLNIRYGEWHKHTSFIDPEMRLVMPHFPANWKDLQPKLEDVKNTSITRIIGYDNIEADIQKIINEKVFNAALRESYRTGVHTKYERYFNEFKKDERSYTLDRLEADIEKAPAAEKKKQAYEELLEAICGN